MDSILKRKKLMSALMLAKGILGVAVLFLVFLVLSFIIPKLRDWKEKSKTDPDNATGVLPKKT